MTQGTNTTRGRAALALAGMIAIAAGGPASSRADSVLSIPVPGASDNPGERLNLTIKIPPKMVPEPEQVPRARVRVNALADFDEHPFKTVPHKDFVFATLRMLERKGVIRADSDRNLLETGVDLWSIIGGVAYRTYQRLLDIHRKGALRKFGLVPEDLERFERVVDILGSYFEAAHQPLAEAKNRIETMTAVVRKTEGRGAIRILGVREQPDGSTLLELEVQRGPGGGPAPEAEPYRTGISRGRVANHPASFDD